MAANLDGGFAADGQLVVAGGDGAVALEPVDPAFHGVALLVPVRVEHRRAATGAASDLRGIRRWHAGIGTGVPGGGHGEPGQVVGPAAGMPGPLVGRQVAMFEDDAGTAALGREPDLQGAGAWRQPV